MNARLTFINEERERGTNTAWPSTQRIHYYLFSTYRRMKIRKKLCKESDVGFFQAPEIMKSFNSFALIRSTYVDDKIMYRRNHDPSNAREDNAFNFLSEYELLTRDRINRILGLQDKPLDDCTLCVLDPCIFIT